MSDTIDGAVAAEPWKARQPERWAWLLRRLVSGIAAGSLTVVTPAGIRVFRDSGAPGPAGVVRLHRWRALRRVVLGGDVGFAQSYIDGDWSSPDLTTLLEFGALNESVLSRALSGSLVSRLVNRLLHAQRTNTLVGSRRNIVEHYDLGNSFYAAWLDPGMTYSSALFTDPGMTLEAAQQAKLDRIRALMRPESGHDVLEIGCGWGGVAEMLARAGCRVTGLTLSPSQLAHARARLARLGLGAAVDLRLQDYREVGGEFDRIVSIEMLEAVGEKFWPVFFDRLRERLKPGGLAVLQVITIADDRFEVYRRRPDFIQRHIFPGGMLPSPSALKAEIARAGLVLDRVETFGASYASTLAEWRERFRAASAEIAMMGFSERFRRLWDYYLCYSEAGFRSGATDVGLWRVARAR